MKRRRNTDSVPERPESNDGNERQQEHQRKIYAVISTINNGIQSWYGIHISCLGLMGPYFFGVFRPFWNRNVTRQISVCEGDVERFLAFLILWRWLWPRVGFSKNRYVVRFFVCLKRLSDGGSWRQNFIWCKMAVFEPTFPQTIRLERGTLGCFENGFFSVNNVF